MRSFLEETSWPHRSKLEEQRNNKKLSTRQNRHTRDQMFKPKALGEVKWKPPARGFHSFLSFMENTILSIFRAKKIKIRVLSPLQIFYFFIFIGTTFLCIKIKHF
jgi:hypothetical protein